MNRSIRQHRRGRDGRQSVLLKVPGPLKRVLAAETERRRCSLNDLIVEVASRHYGLPFQPSGRPGYPSSDKEAVLVRMDNQLKDALRLEAFLLRSNMTDVLLRLLAGEFGVALELAPPHRKVPFGGPTHRHETDVARESVLAPAAGRALPRFQPPAEGPAAQDKVEAEETASNPAPR